jgi:UDP-N-acetyl-D-mannosaminuronate dehydrogenase
MSTSERVVVVGLGEVGRPLLELLGQRFDAVGVDIGIGADHRGATSVLHICFPFEIDDFVGETARYVERFAPRLTVINSTVGVGCTRAVQRRTGAPTVHSPIRGKHARMSAELLHYTKFVGGVDRAAALEAAAHFEAAGMRTKVLSSPEATELAKLTETTYFGLLIAWAQDVSRFCERAGADYDDVVTFYEEIGFLPPVKYFPGVIGGHCVMPNIEILRRLDDSELLRAIRSSNALYELREVQRAAADRTAEVSAH